MKEKLSNIVLILILAAGLSLLLYPTVSSTYNAYLQSQVIVEYTDEVGKMEEEANREALEDARRFNAALLDRVEPFKLSDEAELLYWQLLDTTSRGVMAYIEIPSIAVRLPIAHGTDEDTLADFVGHMKWSSLPVGGESTHCVISGHRGLPSAELFTNIDHLELGDKFYIHVLGQTLEYRINSISVVEPYDYSRLGITEGKDYCTLVTCTPYGVNSHRLLLRGIRTNGAAGPDRTEQELWDEVRAVELSLIIPVCLAVLVIVGFLAVLMTAKPSKGKDQTQPPPAAP